MCAAESNEALPPGRVFSAEGKRLFRIEQVLGTGGFGITYRVKHRNGSDYALKEYFPRQFAERLPDGRIRPYDDEDCREKFQWGLSRFTSEAAVLARCQHDNIVKVIGASISEGTGTGYFLMEYERGRTLHASITKDNLLDQPSALRFAIALLSGLSVVHANGIIHRDIKPANIYLCEDGRPVLLDFGSARDVDPDAPRSVTQLITPGFSPHEQYEPSTENQGPWTDVYSLAACLLACMSGASPRKIDSKKRLVAADGDPVANVLGELEEQQRIAPEFARLMMWAMHLKHDERPQSAAEFQHHLEKFQAASGIDATATWSAVPKRSNAQVEKDFTTLMGDSKVTHEFRDRPVGDPPPDVLLPRMMIIPTGSFMFGSPPSEPGRENTEGPQLWVELRNRFAMAKFAVSNAEYASFLQHSGADASAFTSAPANAPAVGVTWRDAQAYAYWLSQMSGRHYRLPSEQEWEWCCRARSTTAYPWGDAWDTHCGNAASEGAQDVGTYPANAFGLHDCTGNVREWMEDAWHPNHLHAPKEGQARTAPQNMPLVLRVTKGGTWSAPPDHARSAARYPIIETERRNDVGFRVVRDV